MAANGRITGVRAQAGNLGRITRVRAQAGTAGTNYGRITRVRAQTVSPIQTVVAAVAPVEPGDTFTIDASASTGPPTSITVTQTAGTTVTITGSGLTRTVTASLPTSGPETLSFQIAGHLAGQADSTVNLNVVVYPVQLYIFDGTAWVPCLMTVVA